MKIKDSTNSYRWKFYPISVTPALWIGHVSEAKLGSDGKTSYDGAKFSYLWLTPYDTAGAARLTERWRDALGTLTISNATGYLYGTSAAQSTVVTNTTNSFNLAVVGLNVGEGDKEWETVNGNKQLIHFYDTTTQGAVFDNLPVKWEFAAAPEMNGETTLPKFRTTAEQLNTYVPYVELIASGDTASGIKWRIVKASAPDTTLTSGLDFNSIRLDAFNQAGSKISWRNDNGNASSSYSRNNLSTFEGTASFSSAINLANLRNIRVRLLKTSGKPDAYEWSFVYEGYKPNSNSVTPNDNAVSPGDNSGDSNNSVPAPESPVSSSVRPHVPALKLDDAKVVEDIINALKALNPALNTLLRNVNRVYTLDSANGVTVGTNRVSSDMSPADKSLIGNPDYMDVLPAMKITTAGVYVFGVSLDIPVNTPIAFRPLPQDSSYTVQSNSFGTAASSTDSEETYTFLMDSGDETSVVPANQHVNVAAYLEAKSYAPAIVSIPKKADDKTDENENKDETTETENEDLEASSGGGGGGCNAGVGFYMFALIYPAACLISMRKRCQ